MEELVKITTTLGYWHSSLEKELGYKHNQEISDIWTVAKEISDKGYNVMIQNTADTNRILWVDTGRFTQR